MKIHSSLNYLKAHRKKSGLSQRELGLLIGYANEGQVLRHELSKKIPPLVAAFAYEVIFRVSVSDLFPGLFGDVTQMIEGNLAALEVELGQRSGKGHRASVTAQKLTWMTERKGLS